MIIKRIKIVPLYNIFEVHTSDKKRNYENDWNKRHIFLNNQSISYCLHIFFSIAMYKINGTDLHIYMHLNLYNIPKPSKLSERVT